MAGGGTAGVGDLVVTRQNNRRLATGRRWVRNGDRWIVTATHAGWKHDRAAGDGRREGGPSGRLRGRARRAGLRLDAPIVLRVAPSTPRTPWSLRRPPAKCSTSSATRGRESNRLYVDTHYDPDPQTSHDEASEPVTAKEVLAGVLRNEGADVAAHDMIRRQQSEAEGMERLSAEYLTLATLAQAERWDALLARSGLTDADLAAVRASEAHGPLLAAFRDAEARGLDVEAAFPRLVARRSLADAADVAAVLHGRVERWTEAAGGRGRRADNLIAGLIPRAQRVSDPEMAQALAERDQAMEERARHLGRPSHRGRRGLGTTSRDPASNPGPTRTLDKGSLDHRRLPGPLAHHRQRSIGAKSDVGSTEQMGQRQRALAAAARAVAISHDAHGEQASPAWEPQIEVVRGVEL